MLTEKEISLFLGKDSDAMPNGSENLGFESWMVTRRGKDPKWSKQLAYFIRKLLKDYNVPFPSKKDAEKMALAVYNSEYSKSHQRHLLYALEYYMEYVQQPIKLRKPRATKRSPKYLTEEQMKKLIRGARDFKEFAMIMLFCTTGLRLNELRMLNASDIDLKNRIVTVRHAKRDKDREVPLSEECARVLTTYSGNYIPESEKTTSEPFFKSQRGNRWSEKAIESCVKRCASRGGLDSTKISPHVLRHSFATAMLGNGCDIFHLSGILGHSDISTTCIYLHVNDKAKRAAFEKGVPRL